MKFMKLGSKPDQFQSDGDNIRYLATDLATDMIINIGDVKFYVHKFPLLSKSSKLQKLAADSNEDSNDELTMNGIPGGPPAFEICAKFCYGMVVTLNAYNVVVARCAAEFLGMHETLEKGNLIYKIDVFLSSSIFRSWKDSIIVLQTTKSFLPWSEELKLIGLCIDSIAVKASTDPSNVEWSYTYNRKKLPLENGHDSHCNGVKKQQNVPKDWWVEDLCELPIDLFKRVITTVRANESVPADVIGESLKAYALRRLPVLSPDTIQGSDLVKFRYLVDTISWLLPKEKNIVTCGFLLKLLHSSIVLECGETGRRELIQRIAQQLEDATLADLLVSSPTGEMALYNIEIINDMVELYVMKKYSSRAEPSHDPEFQDIHTGITSDASKRKVAKLVDDYLAEAARDPSLPLDRFVNLAEMVSGFPRSNHDGIYRAIDMYLKIHRELTKSEKRRICRLMDSMKLSSEACSHAVQNERLPLRVVVQILFFEQARATGNNTAGFPSSVRALIPSSSCGSSKSATTNSDEDWDANHISSGDIEDRKRVGTTNDAKSSSTEKATPKKVKKVFSRLWSTKDRPGENNNSNTSD